MNLMNIGGVMPDGVRAQDFNVDASEFVCASGAELSESPSIFRWGNLS